MYLKFFLKTLQKSVLKTYKYEYNYFTIKKRRPYFRSPFG